MKDGKNFQSIILAIFGFSIIVAVAAFAGYLPLGGKDDAKQEVLVGEVVIWGSLPAAILGPAITNLQEENGNQLRIKYQQKFPFDLQADYIEALSTGGGPDLIIIQGSNVGALADKVWTIPYTSLPKSQFQSDYIDSSDVFLTDNGVVAMPFMVNPLVMYYNKDILSRYFMLAPPATWDEFYGFSEEVTERDGLSIKSSAVAMGDIENTFWGKDVLATLFLQAKNPIIIPRRQGYSVTLSENFINFPNASAEILKFYTSFVDSQQTHYSWNIGKSPDKSEFLAGRLAVYFGFASEVNDFLRSNPNLNVGVALMPQWEGLNPVTLGEVNAFAVNRLSPNIQLAFNVLWALSGRQYGSYVGQLMGLPPVFNSLLVVNPADPDYVQTFYKSAIISKTWYDPDPNASYKVFNSMIKDTVSGLLEPSRAVTRASLELSRLLD